MNQRISELTPAEIIEFVERVEHSLGVLKNAAASMEAKDILSLSVDGVGHSSRAIDSLAAFTGAVAGSLATAEARWQSKDL